MKLVRQKIQIKSMKLKENERASKNFKLLGILLDEYLSFNDHIGKLCSKIVKSLFCINRVDSVINPMYEYCIWLKEINYSILFYSIFIYAFYGCV